MPLSISKYQRRYGLLMGKCQKDGVKIVEILEIWQCVGVFIDRLDRDDIANTGGCVNSQ
jgi:hypothetical protein